jgi:hypothetical protein
VIAIVVLRVMFPDSVVVLLSVDEAEVVEVRKGVVDVVEFRNGGVDVDEEFALNIVVDVVAVVVDNKDAVVDEVVVDAAGGSTEEGVAETANTPGPEELEAEIETEGFEAGRTPRQVYPASACEWGSESVP